MSARRAGFGARALGVTAYGLDDARRAVLLAAAADAIGTGLAGGERRLPEPGDDPALAQAAATFVTLVRRGTGLGCVGSVEADEALVTSVARHAWNAAFADPGAPVVRPDDFASLEITVSVLSPLSPVRARSWRDVQRVLRPGVDGVLVEAGEHRATLLPSVWDRLSTAVEFLDVLWYKAGLRPRDWLPGTRVRRYSTDDFADAGPRTTVRG